VRVVVEHHRPMELVVVAVPIQPSLICRSLQALRSISKLERVGLVDRQEPDHPVVIVGSMARRSRQARSGPKVALMAM
jgi:hypothetical protein